MGKAEDYVNYWHALTGRPKDQIYVPENLREAEDEPQDDES